MEDFAKLQKFCSFRPYQLHGFCGSVLYPYKHIEIRQLKRVTHWINNGSCSSPGCPNIHWQIGCSPRINDMFTYLIHPRLEYVGVIDEFDF